jgi:HSP20 family protein
MEIMKYERPVSLATLFDELDDVFNAPFSWTSRTESPAITPRVDIAEEEDRYHLKADLPGIDKKDIEVKIENGVLTISGERKSETRKDEKGRYSYYERSYGKFSRSFGLPEHVDTSTIDAHYKDGVLEVNLKKLPQAKPKAIEVKVE